MKGSGRYLALVSFLSLGIASGCNRSGLQSVKGVVTLDGQPVEGASVQFVLIGGEPRPAIGTTDKNGAFTLTTLKPDDGAAPGEYKVLVVKTEVDGASNSGPFDPKAGKAPTKEQIEALKSGEAPKAGGGQGGDKYGPPKKDLLPKIYGDPNKTPLRATVPSSGEIKLELTSKEK
ncbi:MAG TPA: carboxypeptidase-like regulatory domain-containing protein [Gemmataceae bacterium]|jgi:hypothetical protein|nr:carboxypeptidase-like regulatory domain-containing protein [Gemmataceae bacterium]